MAKYFKASDYYPDDKDIYDFLDSQTRSPNPLLMFLKSKNIFASKLSQKENLQNYISLLYFDWGSANRLVDIVDIRETEQKVRHTEFNIIAEPDAIHSIAKTVRDERHDAKREVYNINIHDNEVDINVTYLDIDTSKTRVLQKREKELHITATKTDGGWSFRHTDNERAKNIVKHLVGRLGEETSQESLTEKNIDISNISDNVTRVSFFKQTMSGIEGFRLIDVTNIKVDRLARDAQSDDDSEDEEVLEEKLKKVVMYGVDLFTTPEFQELVNQGFFISGAQWKSEKTDGQGERVEFAAGFNVPVEGKDFVYKVLGVYRHDDAGNLLQTKEKVYGTEKKLYLSALEGSAHAALTTVNGGSNESS